MEISRTSLPAYPVAISGKGQQRSEVFEQEAKGNAISATKDERAPLQPPAEQVYQGEYIGRKSRLDYREVIKDHSPSPPASNGQSVPNHYHTARALVAYQDYSSAEGEAEGVELLPRIDNFV